MAKRLNLIKFGTRRDHSACARTEEEVVQKVGEHLRAIHTKRRFSKDFYQEALTTIREEKCGEPTLRYELLCEANPGVCFS